MVTDVIGGVKFLGVDGFLLSIHLGGGDLWGVFELLRTSFASANVCCMVFF